MQATPRARPLRLGISVLALGGAFGLLFFRHDIQSLLRTAGFWAYLAAVNGELPDKTVLREARTNCPKADNLVPYWGWRPRDGGGDDDDPPPEGVLEPGWERAATR